MRPPNNGSTATRHNGTRATSAAYSGVVIPQRLRPRSPQLIRRRLARRTTRHDLCTQQLRVVIHLAVSPRRFGGTRVQDSARINRLIWRGPPAVDIDH